MDYNIIYSILGNEGAMRRLKALADNKPRLYNAVTTWVVGTAKDKYVRLSADEVYRMTVYLCNYIRQNYR